MATDRLAPVEEVGTFELVDQVLDVGDGLLVAEAVRIGDEAGQDGDGLRPVAQAPEARAGRVEDVGVAGAPIVEDQLVVERHAEHLAAGARAPVQAAVRGRRLGWGQSIEVLHASEAPEETGEVGDSDDGAAAASEDRLDAEPSDGVAAG